MKIIAISKDGNYPSERKYIVEAECDELARIIGKMDYLWRSDKDIQFKPGDKINVHKIFDIIKLVRNAPFRFKEVTKGLDELAGMVRSYNKFYEEAFTTKEEAKEDE